MDFRSKMASGGPNEHTLPHFAGRVGRGMGPPISGDLEKSFLTRVNKPYLQFGAVYGRFFGETASLDFLSKIIEINGFSLQNHLELDEINRFEHILQLAWGMVWIQQSCGT